MQAVCLLFKYYLTAFWRGNQGEFCVGLGFIFILYSFLEKGLHIDLILSYNKCHIDRCLFCLWSVLFGGVSVFKVLSGFGNGPFVVTWLNQKVLRCQQFGFV